MDGSLSQAQRKKALAAFRRDAKVEALLITFGTGSAGYVPLTCYLEQLWHQLVLRCADTRVYEL